MDFLKTLNIKGHNSGTSTGISWNPDRSGAEIPVVSPVNGKKIASVFSTSPQAYESVLRDAQTAFLSWRMIPAPRRGEIVRQIGCLTRRLKDPLAALISYEMGKSFQEGLGEVQEMIDICDYAIGQSRMLSGATMQSEQRASGAL